MSNEKTELELLRTYYGAHEKMSAAIDAVAFARAAAAANAARDALIALRIERERR